MELPRIGSSGTSALLSSTCTISYTASVASACRLSGSCPASAGKFLGACSCTISGFHVVKDPRYLGRGPFRWNGPYCMMCTGLSLACTFGGKGKYGCVSQPFFRSC